MKSLACILKLVLQAQIRVFSRLISNQFLYFVTFSLERNLLFFFFFSMIRGEESTVESDLIC